MSMDQIKAYAALGRGELRGYLLDRKRKINLKAQMRRKEAKSKLALMRIEADRKKEMAELKESTYKAIVAAQQAEKRANEARRAAGKFTFGERLGMAGRGAVTLSGAFVRGLTAPQPRRRRTTTKRRRR